MRQRIPLFDIAQDPVRRRRKNLTLARIFASRHDRIRGRRASTRLVMTGVVAGLAATSFLVTSAAGVEPPPTGRFATLPVGATLPSDQQCAAAVRRMTENRPANATANATRVTTANTVYPRVTGNFTGTTDEIIQWTACKWGIDEDLVRAQTAIESWWNQGARGDMTSTQSSCHPQMRTTTGQCAESVGLMQVRYVYHGSAFVSSNAIRSSAYNMDYAYAIWRSCFEGQLTWLNTVERGAQYRSGDAMGCAGVWFSGRWRTAPAVQYITAVNNYLTSRVWTQASFGTATPTGPTTTLATTTTTRAPTTTTAAAATTTTTRAPTTTTAAATTTTTRAPTTTTAAAATTTTAAPTTTTQPPAGGGFVETFTGNTGLDHFRTGVYHRNIEMGDPGQHGGTWTGDHDLNCGSPDTQRTLRSSANDVNVDEILYNCVDHLMSSMGNVDGYSVLWFTPKKIFNGQTKVSWEVNVTDLKQRKWWEVAIIPAGSPEVTVIDWLSPDPANLPEYPAGSVVVGNGPFGGTLHVHSAGQDRNPTWQPVCGAWALDPVGCASKAIRRPWSVTDNRNGTITVRFNDLAYTMSGSFPSGNFEVVFKDHNYTPDKDGVPQGHSWHWDNIIVS